MNVLDRLDTTLRVVGGARLEGSVEVQGAKNAALPIMAAALLARGKVTLHRVPRITDVSVMWSLLEALGARLSLQDRNTITIDAANVNKHARAVHAGAQARRVVRSVRPAAGPLRPRRGAAARRLRARHARDRHARSRVPRARRRRLGRARLSDRERARRPAARRRDRVPHAVGRRDEERDARGGRPPTATRSSTTPRWSPRSSTSRTSWSRWARRSRAKAATRCASPASRNCTASSTRSSPTASRPERCCWPARSRAAT